MHENGSRDIAIAPYVNGPLIFQISSIRRRTMRGIAAAKLAGLAGVN